MTHDTRVVAVTGAASGIGRAVTDRLHQDGWSVVAVDADAHRLEELPADDRLLAVPADIATEDGNRAFVEAAVTRFGRLDGLVLNAGVAGVGTVDTQPLVDVDRILAVNLRGVILGIRAAVPTLRTGGGGAIVVTASVSGLFGDPGLFAYNASKAGAVNVVRSAALDLGSDGIRVNAVCPGPIRGTGMTAPLERHAADLYAEMRSHLPLGRFGEPAEVAAVAAFLLSDDASYVTGVALPVDGGVTAGTGQFRATFPPSGG
ncbi:MAG TPA: SDR family NAD(P)-dependent oxidoreductase [Acidimicrobiia bacterium]|nr:SDR family NAD(P)-dependent oxidoreductase [Acidimicrobiia bacterium]